LSFLAARHMLELAREAAGIAYVYGKRYSPTVIAYSKEAWEQAQRLVGQVRARIGK
jgi:hypothetical protein